MADDFAYAVEYLARVVGTASPIQLRIIARALGAVNWNLPPPRPIGDAGGVGGYHTCVAARMILRTESHAGQAFPFARGLLEKIPGKSPVRKMCYLHDAAERPRGYRLAAVGNGNGSTAYIENRTLGQTDACDWLSRGWGCLFVKAGSGPGNALSKR
jgi:hypothetical protein